MGKSVWSTVWAEVFGQLYGQKCLVNCMIQLHGEMAQIILIKSFEYFFESYIYPQVVRRKAQDCM